MANAARKDRKRLATTGEHNPTKERTPKAAPPKRRRAPALKAMPADPQPHGRPAEGPKCGAWRTENSLAASSSDAGDFHPGDGRAAFRERFHTLRTSPAAARPPPGGRRG